MKEQLTRININQKNFNRKTKPIFIFLIDSSFQGVNRLFVFSFENEDDGKVHTEYYLLKVEIKDYKMMEKSFLISQLKLIWEHMITFEKL